MPAVPCLRLKSWSTVILSVSGLFKPSKEEERKSRRKTLEQIISKLREAEVGLAQGATLGLICRRLDISEQSYFRWRRTYRGLKMD